MVWDYINYQLIPALLQGSIYALGAVSITLIFLVFRFANFAQGELTTLGGFVVLSLTQFSTITAIFALPVAMVVTVGIAVCLHFLVFDRLKNHAKSTLLIASLLAALALRLVVLGIWGSESDVFIRRVLLSHDLMGLKIKTHEIMTFGLFVFFIAALGLFLTKTKFGKAMNIYADHPERIAHMGLSLRRVAVGTWVIAGGLMALAGFLYGLNDHLAFSAGWYLLLPMFTAALLGGLGRVSGAIYGGFAVSLFEAMALYILPHRYNFVATLVVLILVLVLFYRDMLTGKSDRSLLGR